MIRKDYILRMIEEIGKMIAIILGYLKKEQIHQAHKLYKEGLQRALNLDEDSILEKSADELIAVFENKFGQSYEGIELIASLLARGGDIHLKNKNNQSAKKCYLKALELYNIVEIASGTFSIARQSDMSKVTQMIDQL